MDTNFVNLACRISNFVDAARQRHHRSVLTQRKSNNCLRGIFRLTSGFAYSATLPKSPENSPIWVGGSGFDITSVSRISSRCHQTSRDLKLP